MTAGTLRRSLFALAIAALAVPLAVLAATSPALSVTPSSGPAGTSTNVAGSGFGAGDRGQLLFDGSATAMPKFRVTRTGTFSVAATIPSTAGPGAHALGARMTSGPLTGQIVATADFTVPAPPTQAPTASPSVAPTSVLVPTPTPAPTAADTSQPTPSPTPSPASTATADPTVSPPPPPAAPLAFPGAAGYGREAVGGRGGQVIYVTTLADSGAGSLRAALRAAVPRTVLFAVSGVISLDSAIKVVSPYLTIAGQSAPGDGVVVRGDTIKVMTHDVVIRHMRFRIGDETTADPNDADGLTLLDSKGPVFRVIVDHVDMVWGPDIGGVAILGNVTDVTVQESIMGEGLYLSRHIEGTEQNGGHAYAANVTPNAPGGPHAQRLTFYRNLFTDGVKRMPAIRSAECVDLVNNVIYDWGLHAASGNPRSLNIIGNWYRPGPMTTSTSTELFSPQTVVDDPVLYPDAVFHDANHADGFTAAWGTADVDVYASSPRCGGPSVPVEPAADALDRIIGGVGPTLPIRDAVDQRIIDELMARTGGWFNGINEPSPNPYWPTLVGGTSPADDDVDGMSDEWELSAFGTLARDGAGDTDGDGYTDLEEYLNRTAP